MEESNRDWLRNADHVDSNLEQKQSKVLTDKIAQSLLDATGITGRCLK